LNKRERLERGVLQDLAEFDGWKKYDSQFTSISPALLAAKAVRQHRKWRIQPIEK
jgi:hypothetical protein